MKRLIYSVPGFIWPTLLILLIVSILLLAINPNQDEALENIEIPQPPEMFSSNLRQLGSGNKLGTYYPVGEILVKCLNTELDEDNPLKNAETNGSIENIKLLKSKSLYIAMAESRIALENYEGKHNNSKFDDLRLVWPLWPDIVQILCASGTQIKSVNDLATAKGFLGQKNSSTLRSSSEILRSYGITPNNVMLDIEPSEVLTQLSDQNIDFAVIQAGIPNLTISDALIFRGCSLISFTSDDILRLKKVVSTSRLTSIPAQYYDIDQPNINTLGIPNALWTRKDVSSETVELIVKTLIEGLPRLRIQHKATVDIPSDPELAFNKMQRIGVPIHGGTLNYLRKASPALLNMINNEY